MDTNLADVFINSNKEFFCVFMGLIRLHEINLLISLSGVGGDLEELPLFRAL